MALSPVARMIANRMPYENNKIVACCGTGFANSHCRFVYPQ